VELHRKHKNKRERSYGGGGSLMHSQGTESSSRKVRRVESPRGATENTIRGKVVASPSLGRGESSESKLPVACPNTQRVQNEI
jgi:hypothetical protein